MTYPSQNIFNFLFNLAGVFSCPYLSVKTRDSLFDFLCERVKNRVFIGHITKLHLYVNPRVVDIRVYIVRCCVLTSDASTFIDVGRGADRHLTRVGALDPFLQSI